MNISPINSSLPASAVNLGDSVAGASSKVSGEGFGSLIRDTLDSMNGTQKSAEQEISKAVTGESPDLHKTIISLQSSELKFQFGLQVRNKLIGAYEEIMRMQI